MLDGGAVSNKLVAYDGAVGNLTASCEGIEQTQMPQSEASKSLREAKQLAHEWLSPEHVAYRASLVTDLAHTASLFQASDAPNLAGLQSAVTGLVQNLNEHIARLKRFGTLLGNVQARMQQAIGQLQAKRNNLEAQVSGFNREIASLQREIQQDRNAIAEADSHRGENIAKTIFGILLAPVTGGASITIAGMGAVSLAEAEGRIHALDSMISESNQRMIHLRGGLNDDDAALASLGLVLVPGETALGDLNSASQSLGDVTTGWTMFQQEMQGVLGDLASSSAATMSIVQKAWYDAACGEMREVASTLATMR